MTVTISKGPSLKEQQHKLREDAILDATHVLLGRKGYEAMTMDDVAAEVGIAKGSLYKHFLSKERLAAAVMVRMMRRAVGYLEALPAGQPAHRALRAMLRWALETRLEGGLPHLPSTSSTLQESLLSDPAYLEQLLALNARVTALIDQARRDGDFCDEIPSEVAMYMIYARSCDPTVDLLRASGVYTDGQIVELMLKSCFDGLSARTPRADEAGSGTLP
jgi:AcrR family transcriptional regulator